MWRACIVLLVMLAPLTLGMGVARAQPSPEDRMMAQALFDDAIKLMAEDDFDEACPKFEESHRLDPGIGVKFRLADCYEQAGRIARAWILFVDVAAAARSSGQEQRAAAAKRRALDLEPRLSKLRIDVIEPISELVVTRNGVAVRRAQWGTSSPVEIGDHVIEARAAGHKTWRSVVNFEGEGVHKAITVPPLEELPPPEPTVVPRPDRVPVAPSNSAAIRRAFGIGLGGLGIIGLGIGIGAGVVAIDTKNDADSFCPEEGRCFQRGLDLREDASDAAAISTVGFVVGVPAIAGGLILWLTADEDQPNAEKAFHVRPLAVPGGYGLGVGGRF